MAVGKKTDGGTKRELILKALTDPKYRKRLETDPAAAMGLRSVSETQRREIALVLAAVRGIDRQIGQMADQLLCNNGGCSVAV